MDGMVALTISLAERVSIAFHQNEVPIASEIVVSNRSEDELAEIEIRLRSEPGFFVPAVWRLERIVGGGVHHIALPDLQLDPGILAKLTETVRAQVTLTATMGEVDLTQHRVDVELLPPSHWGGVLAAPELLAAFVRPNDPAVDLILGDAAAALAAAGRPTAIDGYKSQRKARAYEHLAFPLGLGVALLLQAFANQRIGRYTDRIAIDVAAPLHSRVPAIPPLRRASPAVFAALAGIGVVALAALATLRG